MDDFTTSICQFCHATVSADAFFCPNCGKPLKEKPPATTVLQQIVVYSVSLFVPPFGFWYAWKYLRRSDEASRKIGVVAIVLTVISIIITVWLTQALVASLQQSLTSDLNSLGY